MSQRAIVAEPSSSRFALNISTNIAYAALNMALMAWYIPFLIRHLGVDAYGMIALSNTLVAYAAIVSASLDTSITRFLAIEMNRGDVSGANRIFNASLALSAAGSCVLAVPAAAVAVLFPVLFAVPAGLEQASSILFASVAFTTLAAIVSGTFGSASIVLHRFELRNAVRGATSVSRFGLVALLVLWHPATLYDVAAGFAISACIGLAGDIVVWRRLTPQLHVRPGDVEPQTVRALMGLGGWSAVSQLGLLLLMQIDLVLVNRFFGPEATGQYGSLILLPAVIYTATEPVIAVLSPAIMARYAVGDRAGLRRLVDGSVKLLGLGLALPIGLLCGFAKPLLTLWLGPAFGQFHVLVILLVGHLTISLAARPLAYLLTAYNRVKIQGVATLLFGVAKIGLALALIKWTDLGMAGVAASTAAIWIVRNLAFFLPHSAVVAGWRWWSFYPPIMLGVVWMAAIGLAVRIVVHIANPTSWAEICIWAIGIGLIYCLAVYTVGLNGSDRALLRKILRLA